MVDSTPRWFYVENENRLGPVAVEQIAHLIMNGGLSRTALVWRHGLSDWTEAGRIPEIASLLPPPLPAGKTSRTSHAPEMVSPKAEPAPAAEEPSPRIEELRRKLEADANPRRYAQVAEDLRKEGEFAEAIRVCREGLERHAYPSLRLTLGRVLLEGGDLVSARAELESVVSAAPDNILAQRLLAECRAAMGEPAVAASPAPGRPPVPPTLTPAAAAPSMFAAEPPPIVIEPRPAHAPEPPPPAAARESKPRRSRADVSTTNLSELPTLDGPPGGVQTLGQRLAQAQQSKRVPAAPPAPPPAPAPAAAAPAPRPDEQESPLEITEDPPASPRVGWPSGRLADHEFADLVREVHGRRWSGLLTLNHMGVETTVRIQDGRLVFASSSSKDDRLGELLLRRGRITLDQYVEAGRGIRKGKRLGTVLVEMGALDAKELVKVVIDHTQEIIYGAFQWTEGLYHLTETTDPAEPIVLRLSTPDIILEGIRRIDRWSRIERAVGGLETRYDRVEGYEAVLRQMTLSPDKLALLTGLNATQDLGAICRRSNMPHFDVCRTLWSFRVIGVVRRLD
jgi:GYF domain 2/Domain of unknown function (DUF4388)/Tetratricopeptide repeat